MLEAISIINTRIQRAEAADYASEATIATILFLAKAEVELSVYTKKVELIWNIVLRKVLRYVGRTYEWADENHRDQRRHDGLASSAARESL